MTDIIIRIDGTSAGYDKAASVAEKATLRVASSMKVAAKAQLDYDKAVADFGVTSDKAVAAQKRLEAATTKTAEAEKRAAIASKYASEQMVRDQAAVARAAQASADKQTAAAEKQAAALKTVGTAAGKIGTVAAVGLIAAAAAAADFNSKMAQVQSLTRGSASQVAALAAATKNYANLGISATQAADAEIELVKAGVSVKDILGGALDATLHLAAAGQIDVAQATEIASAAMVQFGLKGTDMNHVADLLAAGADKSLGSVSDLGEGLKAVGTTAHQFGLSIDDTVGALSQLAAAGLTGSLGGTALKQALLKLEAPSVAASKVMAQYGISLYTASGHEKTLAELAGNLQSSFKGVDDQSRNAALGIIFGSRAIQVANVLYKDGAKQTQNWADKINASGFAAAQARGKMDSLVGDLDKLKASAINGAIAFGQQLQPALRTITQGLTDFLNIVADVPDPVKAIGVNLTVMAAALGLGFWAFTRMQAAAVRLAETLGVLSTAQVEVGTTAVTMATEEDAAAAATGAAGGAGVGGVLGRLDKGALARAAGGVGLILGGQALFQVAQRNPHSSAAPVASIGAYAATGAGLGLSLGPEGVAAGGLLGAVYGGARYALGHPSVSPVTQARFPSSDPFTKTPPPVSGAQLAKVSPQAGFSAAADATTHAVQRQNAAFQALLSSARQMQLADEGLTSAQQKADKAFGNSIGSAASLTLGIEAARQQTKSLGDAMTSNGKAINLQSHAGATLAQALQGIAAQAVNVTGSETRQKNAIDQGRQAIIAMLEAHGAAIPVAKEYADKLLAIANNANRIPSRKTVNVNIIVTGQAALDRVALSVSRLGQQYTTGVQLGQAAGGYISGPGSGTSDSIPSRLSNGEFVMKAAAVQKYGVSMMHDLNAMRLSGGGLATRMAQSMPYRGGAQTVVMTDPAVVDRLAAIESALGRDLNVRLRNMNALDNRTGSIALRMSDRTQGLNELLASQDTEQ